MMPPTSSANVRGGPPVNLLRLAFPAILLAAMAALAAACGGSGETLTLEEYFQRLDELDNQADERGQAIEDEFPQAFEEPKPTQEFINSLAALVGDFVDSLEQIDPPAQVEDAHNEAAAAGTEFAQILEEAAPQLEGVESASELEETLGDLFAEDSEFAAADERFTNSCVALQQIADDNDIDADLECD